MSSSSTQPGVTPRLAFAISGMFLAIIVLVPLVQFVDEIQSQSGTWPTAFQLVPQIAREIATAASLNASAYSRVMTANQLMRDEFRNYERHVTESAWVIDRPRAWLQASLTGPLRSGNDQVVVGSEGWLFFRPDVEGITCPGFLQPQVIRPGIDTKPRQSNPLPAIRRFAADLKARGIELIILPISSKGGMLGRDGPKKPATSPIHNASFQQFLTELDQSQISYCDPTAVLLDDQAESDQTQPRYLKTDSHWTPVGMQRTVELLAERVREAGLKQRNPQPLYETAALTLENIGDTARLLGHDTAAQVSRPERVVLIQVKNADHSDWAPDPHAEILILGDSFTNIFSQAELGWGTSAGFAEHLSLTLNQPIDRIAMNAGGAVAARRELGRQIQQSTEDRLGGKKLVVWQFAERELALGDWQVLPLPAASNSSPAVKSQALATITVEGLIVQAGHLPDPASLPYREALIPLHLQSVKSTGKGTIPAEIVVYAWGMRDRRLTQIAQWKSGQRVRLKLVPWSAAEREYGRFARAELDDPDFRLIDLPTYWGTP